MNISDDELPLIIRALEHYGAYLAATQRDDRVYRELAEQMKRKRPSRNTRSSRKSECDGEIGIRHYRAGWYPPIHRYALQMAQVNFTSPPPESQHAQMH